MEAATQLQQESEQDVKPKVKPAAGKAKPSRYVVLEEVLVRVVDRETAQREGGPVQRDAEAALIVADDDVPARTSEEAEATYAARGEDDGKPRAGTFRAVPYSNFKGASVFDKELKPVTSRRRVD